MTMEPETPADQPDEDAKEQLLKESEERTLDPATRDLEDDTVERRRSDDLVSDAETENGPEPDAKRSR